MNGRMAKRLRRVTAARVKSEQAKIDGKWFAARWWLKLWRWVRGLHKPILDYRRFYRHVKANYTRGAR